MIDLKARTAVPGHEIRRSILLHAHDLERARALPLFAHMAPDAFQALAAETNFQRFPPGALLLLEGEAVDSLHILLKGQVELHGTWNDQETVLAVLHPVSTFILAAIVLEADALMSARTLDHCEILMLPGAAIRQAMTNDGRFANAVARDLAGGFRTMARAVKNQKLRSGVERLANHLVMLHASDPVAGANIVLRHEKRVLASLLGMTPENLSRAFAALRAQGVHVRGNLVELSDLPALVALAKPDPLIDNHAPGRSARAAAVKVARRRA